jgi:type II secretory pathway component PulK
MNTFSVSKLRKTHRAEARCHGFATFMVLWAIALLALVLVAIQSSAFRQAAGGREAVARVRAQWAARAGVEATIARLTQDTLSPDVSSATAVYSDLAGVARGDLGGTGPTASASYSIKHFDGTQEVDGPEDAHSKLNVNTLETADLILLDAMDDTTAQSIHNWIHGVDDTALTTGADEGNYTGLRYPYKPRGAPVRSLKELELVQGVDPQFLRGEDANYNGRLDPGEDDADASLPMDNADGIMDAGWSRYLTAVSEVDKPTSFGPSGTQKLDLRVASTADIGQRLQVDENQAQAISNYAAAGSATMADFVRTELGTLAQTAASATLLNGRQQQSTVTALSRDQLKLLLDECVISSEVATQGVRSGKFNINTIPREVLERFSRIEPDMQEAILTERDGRSGGFTSMADLLDIPNMTNELLATMMGFMDVRSNVFVVSSRGKDRTTGIEVEVVAVIDRTSIPVVIRDLSVR